MSAAEQKEQKSIEKSKLAKKRETRDNTALLSTTSLNLAERGKKRERR